MYGAPRAGLSVARAVRARTVMGQSSISTGTTMRSRSDCLFVLVAPRPDRLGEVSPGIVWVHCRRLWRPRPCILLLQAAHGWFLRLPPLPDTSSRVTRQTAASKITRARPKTSTVRSCSNQFAAPQRPQRARLTPAPALPLPNMRADGSCTAVACPQRLQPPPQAPSCPCTARRDR